jgi:thioredoxin-related protein
MNHHSYLRLLTVMIPGVWMLGIGSVCAQDGADNLPEWSEPSTKLPLDSLAPDAGLLPDPGPEGQPSDLPPAHMLPDVPPLQGPRDGSEEPELPDLPGLVAPKEAPVPLNGAGQPARPDPLANIVEVAHWHRSPREARKIALEQGRPMLLVFGGFGWSPACQALNNDLFTNAGFKQFAAKKLVLSFLNVPTRSATSNLGNNGDLKQQQIAAIKAYQKFLRVRSLPTMILFDSEGHEVERLVGYNFNKVLRVASLTKLVNRLEMATNRLWKQKEEQEARRKLLTETQDYRIWTSRIGTTLFAKASGLVNLPAPTEVDPAATEPAAQFMDDRGAIRHVPLRSLVMMDAEVVKRRFTPGQAGVDSLEASNQSAAPGK